MVATTSQNVIIPEVWGDEVQAEFVGRLIFGQDGGQFAEVDTTLEGQPGERVKSAKWLKIADELSDIDEDDVIVPKVLDSDSENGPVIKEAADGVEIKDRANLVGMGDPGAEARRQFGVMTARKIDSDLHAVALAQAAHTYDHAGRTSPALAPIDHGGQFSAGAVARALGYFGDAWEPTEFGFVIHSMSRTDLFLQDEFISADKYPAGATLVRGQIGDVYGVPIIVSDRITATGAGDDLRRTQLLMRRQALKLFYKRRPIVETDRDILARSTVITTNVHYAAGVNDGGKGIVKVITK